MKRLITAILLATSLGLSFLVPASGAVKAGTSCTKLKATTIVSGYKYTCIKSGKKLVWSKGVKVAVKVTPTPSPESTLEPQKVDFIPWSSKFETLFLTRSAIEQIDSYIGKVIPNNDYELIIDPIIKESDRSWIKAELDFSNGFFSNIKRTKVKVFLGASHEWSLKTVRAENLWLGDSREPYPCSQGIRDAYCADGNLILLIYSDIYGSEYSSYNWEGGRRSTPAHEFFHTVQYALGGSSIAGSSGNQEMRIPRWLNEGSANFFGFYVVDKLGIDSYQEGRFKQLNSNPDYKSVIPLKDYSFSNLNPYGIGQGASEYLIASIGFEKFLNIWKFTNSESSFNLGFKKATGIDIEDFYTKFEAARESIISKTG